MEGVVKMKIQFCSDLHLEMYKNEDYLIANPLPITGDILVLAGDIMKLNNWQKHMPILEQWSNNYNAIFWLPGNHEYYGCDVSEFDFSLNIEILPKVFLVNNTIVTFGGINLIFSTLWTKVGKVYVNSVERGLNDYFKIKNNSKVITTDYTNEQHRQCLEFLEKALAERKGQKNIVVTHHAPTFENYAPHFKGDPLNAAFGTELREFIKRNPIKYWIFGHTHYNPKEFVIGKTTLLTNQLGYVQYLEHLKFKPSSFIEI